MNDYVGRVDDRLPLGGNMIDWRWFCFYTREPGGAIIQSWDTASKPGELNDYSVGTTWLIQGERYYILALHRERCDAPTLRKRVIAKYREFRPEGVLIEDKGSGMDEPMTRLYACLYAPGIQAETSAA